MADISIADWRLRIADWRRRNTTRDAVRFNPQSEIRNPQSNRAHFPEARLSQRGRHIVLGRGGAEFLQYDEAQPARADFFVAAHRTVQAGKRERRDQLRG